MGNEVSSRRSAERDLLHLREHFPFDDDTLKRLYQIFCAMEQQSQQNDRSFLFRLVEHNINNNNNDICANREDDNEEEEEDTFLTTLSAIPTIEQVILPPHFGETLQRIAFLRPADRQEPSQQRHDDCDDQERLEAFFDGLTNCLGGGRPALGTLFETCVESDEHPSSPKNLVDSQGREIKTKVINVLDAAYRLALATMFLQDQDTSFFPEQDWSQNKVLQSLALSCLEFVTEQRARRSVAVVDLDDSDLEQGYCSKMDFMDWSERKFPRLSSILPTFFHASLFPGQTVPSSLNIFSFPQLNDESVFFMNDNSTLLFSFACMSKSLGGTWHRLYTSESDGLSFNRLQNALLGYGGPSLIVIMAADGSIFGSFTASKWKESPGYYGDSDCFLYQVSPKMAVYRPTGNETNYMFCNSQTKMHGYSQLPRGIGFGGSVAKGQRLFIDETFSGCFVSSRDMTFEFGHLLPPTDSYSQKTYFNIDQLEVWGCSGGDNEVVSSALESRRQERSMRAAQIRNLRKVDKAAFLGDLRAGLIESKAFTHVDQIQGSTRFHILNRGKNDG